MIYLAKKKKKKNIVVASENSSFIIKSLSKLEEEPLEFSGYKFLWYNKIVIYSEGSGYFAYDIDTKKKKRISETCDDCSLRLQDIFI